MGSVYLHCDPTASYHVRVAMDAVFGRIQFRNEIVWCYSGGGAPKKAFARKHDIILFYKKNIKNYIFNLQYRPYSKDSYDLIKSRDGIRINGYKIDLERGSIMQDWWADINALQTWTQEKEGYPTQKPCALCERIIKASSNP